MSLILKDVSISIGGRELLLDESVGIADGAKVGMIGRNGVGKTTLLKAILGQVDYRGKIEFNGKAAIFSQNVDLGGHKTVKEVLDSSVQIHHQNSFEEELKEVEAKLGDPKVHEDNAQMARLSERYVELLAKVASHAPVTGPNNRLAGVLRLLEIPDSWLNQELALMSTGQRAIVALAQILSSDVDLLLLDEPTNHLDFKRLDILEKFIKSFKGTVLMVSHDRYFLDQVCDTILKIEKGKLLKFNGNYSAFVKAREALFEAQMTAYTLENKYLAAEKDKIARIGKAPLKVAQGKYREKALEKREVVEKPDLDKTKFKTHFDASPMFSSVVLDVKDLTIGYDKPLLKHITFGVGKDQRVVLIGDNGVGKSTLFKTIEGRLPPIAGKVEFDQKAVVGYADQELKDLTGTATLYDEIYAFFKDLSQTRRHLSMMGFIEDSEVFKPINSLSMGEKMRLNLLKILIEKPNILLLDEPTNHLDIDAREIIENAFLNFDGAIFAVSHDRYFIDKVAQITLRVQNGTIKQQVHKTHSW